jgi:hypothetical protein
MANVWNHNPIILDTFTSDIDFKGQFPRGLLVHSIQWTKSTTVGHVCIIKSGEAPLLEFECSVVGKKMDKYYKGTLIEDINIPANSVQSGKLYITVR